MIHSVSFTHFRGLDGLELPLAKTTMLTGTNSVGKTSVLEGLYCLFSETRLDVAPLSRYDKTFGFIVHQQNGMPVGFEPRQGYNYSLFWNECPAYGQSACSITGKNETASWLWEYKKAGLSDLPETMLNNNPFRIDSSTQFAFWRWQLRGSLQDMQTSSVIDTKRDFNRIQVLTPDGGLYLWPSVAIASSICRYFDFSSIRPSPQQLTFRDSQQLTEALKLINPHVTDVRNTGGEDGLSVILDADKEVTLGTLGNGAVAWVSVLRAILDTVKTAENLHQPSIPYFILIDEMGAGIHYSVMQEMWSLIRKYSDSNPHIQFVFTSHSDDCVRAYCEAFANSDSASLVRLHRRGSDGIIVPTNYAGDDFTSIIDGEWEVRG